MQMRPNPLKTNPNYCPGTGCTCWAHSSNECGCPNVDWTPIELYELRLKVEQLEAELKVLREQQTTKMHFEDLSG